MSIRFDKTAMPLRWALRIWIIVTVAATSLTGAIPGMAQEDEAPVDLAAMTLRPDDLEAEGYDDHALWNSILTAEPAAVADFTAVWRGAAASPVIEAALDEAEPDQAYLLQLVETARPGDMFSGTESRVVSYVFAFGDEDTATKGFAVLADAWASDPMEETDTGADVGDERIMVEGSARDRNGSRYQRVDLLFRVNHLVSGVSVETYDATPPEAETVEGLAERQADLVEAVLEDGGAGLSQLILRLEVPGRNAILDLYTVQDGERFRRADETADEAAENQAVAEDFGIVDAYTVEQQILGDALDSADLPVAFLPTRVVRFADEDGASAYLRDAVDRLQEGSANDLEEVGDVPEFGDEVAAYTYTHTRSDGVVFHDYRIYIRVDADFFTMAINTTEDIDLEAVNELAKFQADCLSGDASCLEPQEIPRPLQGVESEKRIAFSATVQDRVEAHRRT
jgi:hypothetical protein